MISVVIPILNEAEIADFVAAVRKTLGGRAHEILLVNDGAPVTVNGAREVPGAHRGKGHAVRQGILASAGDIVIVIDADLAALLPQLPRFVDLIGREGNDVVIAEREHEVRERTPLRYALSYGLLLAQRLFVFQSFRFRDTQCGLKAFRGDVARAIARKQRVDGGMYDIEYLYAAVRNRLRIAQVAVGRVAEERPSRIRLLACLRSDPAALAGVKWRGLSGRYKL
ncbi:MAG TPA: glycosyltransferase [Thermoanaerobaculia bacterium]|jgi:dolichyl-phosphate beta-glucosyltransferase|nr:glycosyltransferase [Thermoanaerobaculia bacterium]